MRNSYTPADIRDYAISKAALAEIEKLVKGDFVKWARNRDIHDPLIIELHDRYHAEFKHEMHKQHATLLKTILRCAKRHKVRFLSLSRFDLITFEDISYPMEQCIHGWPVAWHIAKVCNIDHGAGNSSQHQIHLEFFPSYNLGTYDLRGRKPMIVGDFVQSTRDWEYVTKKYNDLDSVASYLRTCNIQTFEPAKLPYLGDEFPNDSRWNVRIDSWVNT